MEKYLEIHTLGYILKIYSNLKTPVNNIFVQIIKTLFKLVVQFLNQFGMEN